MRTLIRLLVLLLPIGWITYIANDGAAVRTMEWVNIPTTQNLVAVGLLLLAGLGWGLTCRPTKRGQGWAVALLGVLVATGGYLASSHFGLQRMEDLAGQRVRGLGDENLKPDLSKIVVGYHYLTPTEGGPVAIANGAVFFQSPEEFKASPKAVPADVEPVWQSPTKTREERPAPKDEPEVQRKLRMAAERAMISNDLKKMVTAQYYANSQPPRNPDELSTAAKLDERQQAALKDGTYVWHFGWTRFDLKAVEAEKEKERRSERVEQLSWCLFLLSGLGGGLLLYGIFFVARCGTAKSTPSGEPKS